MARPALVVSTVGIFASGVLLPVAVAAGGGSVLALAVLHAINAWRP